MIMLTLSARRLARGDEALLSAIRFFENDLREGKWSADHVDLTDAPRISPEDWPSVGDQAVAFIEQRLGRKMRYPIDGMSYVAMREQSAWEDSRLTEPPEPGRVHFIPASLIEMAGLRKTVSLESVTPITTPEQTAWVLKIPATGLSEGWRGYLLLMQAVTWQQKKTDLAAWDAMRARVKRTAIEKEVQAFSQSVLELEHRLVVHALPHGSIAGRTNPFDSIEDMEAAKGKTVKEFEEAFGPPLSKLELAGRQSSALWASCALFSSSLRGSAENRLAARR